MESGFRKRRILMESVNPRGRGKGVCLIFTAESSQSCCLLCLGHPTPAMRSSVLSWEFGLCKMGLKGNPKGGVSHHLHPSIPAGVGDRDQQHSLPFQLLLGAVWGWNMPKSGNVTLPLTGGATSSPESGNSVFIKEVN